TYGLIVGIVDVPAGIPGSDRHHAAHVLEHSLGAPEAAATQYCDFHHEPPGALGADMLSVSGVSSAPPSSVAAASSVAGASETIHAANCRAVAGSRCRWAGMGMAPHKPRLPSRIVRARYCAAASLPA